VSYTTLPSNWWSVLLLACRLIEGDQRERAEKLLVVVIEAQLSAKNKGGMVSFIRIY
jgi:hypothetical protein